jgi:site-specific recombinase XerC
MTTSASGLATLDGARAAKQIVTVTFIGVRLVSIMLSLSRIRDDYSMDSVPGRLGDGALHYPDWFWRSLPIAPSASLRRIPSRPTGRTVAIAAFLAKGAEHIAQLGPDAITKVAMLAAFAAYADAHEAASIRRCWSNSNTLCYFLFRAELIALNPMSLVGRPKAPKSLPKGLGGETVSGLLRAIDHDDGPRRRSDWAERDRAIVLMAVLAGLRADELVRADVGDIRSTDEGGVIHVRGKGNKDRRIPVEQALIRELDVYLDSRAARFPRSTKRRPSKGGLAAWPAAAPLFVGSDGQRITRGTLQYRVLRAFKKAGLNSQRAPGVLNMVSATRSRPSSPMATSACTH